MTAISAHRGSAGTTAFERSLLRASATLDHFVTRRLERRATPEWRRAIAAQTRVADARIDAQALGALGLLPR